MSNYLKLSALALGLVCAGHAAAENLTAVSFGGANKQAREGLLSAVEAAGHGRIVAGEYNGEMAKVKAMVDTNSVSWNPVEVESPELARGCDEGCSRSSSRASSAIRTISSRVRYSPAALASSSGRRYSPITPTSSRARRPAGRTSGIPRNSRQARPRKGAVHLNLR